jgi:hypothetical protein
MKRIALNLMSLTLALVVAAPLFAADKKKSTLATSVLKKFEKAQLTEEQVTKIKDLATKVAEKTAPAKKRAVYTPEQMKAREEALKKARAEGKKGKELTAAIKDAAKLTPTQVAAVREIQTAYSAMMKEILGMLSDEQKARLPRKSRSKK